MRLRYAGTCVRCGSALDKGATALYYPATHTVRCLVCPEEVQDLPDIDVGTPGGSAWREYERRKTKREERIKGNFGGLLGGAILALTNEPQSTRAWARGSRGEQELAESLERVPGIQALYDRKVPGTRGNLDALLIAPAGIFVVDVKRYEGLIRVRDRGGWFRSDLRLYVGRRDCSELADNMEWQVHAVEAVLHAAGFDPAPPVESVLCFVNGEWPLFRRPTSFGGVHLEGARSICDLITSEEVLCKPAIDRFTRVLTRAFPAK
jgi:hypothetical protein